MWSRAVALFTLAIALALTDGCRPRPQSVVVYTSVDQVYSEPILQAFAQTTGIQVRPVFDVEATKTTGLVNRLIAEAPAPQADVWWNGEFAQTLLLKDKGVLAPYRPARADELPPNCLDADQMWTALAGRARVIIVNTDLVAEVDYPRTREDLVADRWRPGEIGIAYPLFGTTATEAAALYAVLGPERARAWYRRLRASGARVVDGNSVVRDLVAAGQLKAGLTDTDDAYGAVKRGAPVTIILPDQEGTGTLIIPGTVALVAKGPNPEAGARLVDFLTSPEAERMLIDSGFAQIPLHASNAPPAWLHTASIKAMDVTFEAISQQLPIVQEQLREVFVR